MISLSEQLGQRVRAGRKLLMPYLMAGVTREWVELIPALAEAGVDGLEIGLPFSDPMIDGVTVQKAASRALSLGATPSRMLDELSTLDNLGIPLTVMTYANVVFAHPGGSRAFLQRLADSGVAGVIVPDLPLEESREFRVEAEAVEVSAVQLAAPECSDDRLAEIGAASRGFVYAVTAMQTTGERAELAEGAVRTIERVRSHSELPVVAGFGISSPEQAVVLAGVADGVIIGSSVVRVLLETGSAAEVVELAGRYRTALDRVCEPVLVR